MIWEQRITEENEYDVKEDIIYLFDDNKNILATMLYDFDVGKNKGICKLEFNRKLYTFLKSDKGVNEDIKYATNIIKENIIKRIKELNQILQEIKKYQE